MEVGQIIHNNPVGLEASEFVNALIYAIRRDITRVYWNVNQKQWKGDPEVDLWSDEAEELSYDTTIPGIEWRPYYNWGGCPSDPDWDQDEANKPNFSFEGVEIRWYKRFGRSMNVNVCWSAAKWQRWFERCVQAIDARECEHWMSRGGMGGLGEEIKYPDPGGKVPLEFEPDDIRFLKQSERIETLEARLNCIACVCIDVADGKKPRFESKDWRWCKELEWVTRLGLHALKAKTKFILQPKEGETS